MNKLTYFTAKALTLLNRLYTLDDYFHPIYSNILLLSVPWMYMFSLYLPHLMIIFILCNIILLSIPCMYMFCQLYKITPRCGHPSIKAKGLIPNGGYYRGVPLYNLPTSPFSYHFFPPTLAHLPLLTLSQSLLDLGLTGHSNGEVTVFPQCIHTYTERRFGRQHSRDSAFVLGCRLTHQ